MYYCDVSVAIESADVAPVSNHRLLKYFSAYQESSPEVLDLLLSMLKFSPDGTAI